MNNAISKSLGLKIKSFREKLGLSQEELAMKARINRSYLSLIENNKQLPAKKTLRKIAQELNITVDALLEKELPIQCLKKEPIVNELRELANKYDLNQLIKGLFQLVTENAPPK